MANSTGIIDSGYRGYIIGALDNIGITYINSDGASIFGNHSAYTIKRGQRLFQICAPNLNPIDNIVVTDHLEQTIRGSGGFGSTGR